MKRKPTKRGKVARKQFAEFKRKWLGTRCPMCERRATIDPHHIVKRKGDAWDDPRNLIALCRNCHDRVEGDWIDVTGRRHRQWTDEDVERAKRRVDPDNWDARYLDYLRHFEKHLRETGSMEYQEDV